MAYNKMSEDPLFNGQGYTNPAENAENKRVELADENQIFESVEDFDENKRIGKAYPEEEGAGDGTED